MPYHKRPSAPATGWDILNGARVVSRLARKHAIDVFHARGHISAAIGAIAKRWTGAKLIFDIRGFMPEEYVDAGLWPPGGSLYRAAKRTERWLLDAADGFVILTDRARSILSTNYIKSGERERPIEVIPCCVDFTRFAGSNRLSREDAKLRYGLEGRRVIAYVGALGGWYMTNEIVEFMQAARERDPSTYSMILTQSDPGYVTSRLSGPAREDAGAPPLGLSAEDFFVGCISPEEVPLRLAAVDIGLSFIKPCYSKIASSPTKFAEYLAAGVPVVTNTGVGDLESVIEADSTGVLLTEFSPEGYRRALIEVDELLSDPALADRCRSAAWRRFDLRTVGGPRYRRLYERVANSGPRAHLLEQRAS
jgi:glycosyltransferase involved in cell wall biosynthesis